MNVCSPAVSKPLVHRCRVCGQSAEHPCWSAREMQFGTRQTFDYFQCLGCGCLQIAQIPAEMGAYYPPQYYSTRPLKESRYAGIPGWFRLLRPRLAMRGIGSNPKHFAALHGLKLSRHARVLDVGCGNGKSFAYLMRQMGYDAAGCDPFLPSAIRYANGLVVDRATLAELADADRERSAPGWDLIAFHHSFEHVPDPGRTLEHVAGLLRPSGVCLIRIPVASGDAWLRYRTDWVQLDAPRHLFLHTPESMAILARQAGLAVARFQCDSDYFQFWASQNYQRDMALKDQKKGRGLAWQIRRWRWNRLADRLNRQGLGDQAVFILKRV